MFGIRRTSTLGRKPIIEAEVKTGPIDEVDGLCQIFGDFFNAAAKISNQK